MKLECIPNILVFGSTGAGKSSVVNLNMLDDDAYEFIVSNSADVQ
jgi:guanylate kinase